MNPVRLCFPAQTAANIPKFQELSDILPPWEDLWNLRDLAQDPVFLQEQKTINDKLAVTPALSTRAANFWSHPRVPSEVRQMVTQGVSPKIDLVELSKHAQLHQLSQVSYHCCRSDRELTIACNQLLEAERMGALIEIQDSEVKALCKFFVAYNKSAPRVVCHPKAINQVSLSPVRVAYEDLRFIRPHLKPGFLLMSIDLKKAYWQVAIADWLIPWTAMRVKGRCLAWRSLILGLNFAPAAFTMITQPIMNALRSWGVQVFRYIDDLIIIAPPEQAQAHTHMTFLTLRLAGFVCNLAKSEMVPSLTLRHLGLLIDLGAMRFRVPLDKTNDISNLARALSAKPAPKATSIGKLIGKLMSVSLASSIVQHKTWSLLTDLYAMPDPWNSRIPLSPKSQDDLRWIAMHLHAFNSRPIHPRPSMMVLTDASDWGWGVCIPHLSILAGGPWSNSELPPIMIREFWAVLTALDYVPRGSVISVVTDSTPVLFYLRKGGGMKSQELFRLTCLLWEKCSRLQVEIENSYWIPSSANIAADRLSRGSSSSTALLLQQSRIMSASSRCTPGGFIVEDSTSPLSHSLLT